MGKLLNDVSKNNASNDIWEVTLASPGKWCEVLMIKEPTKRTIPIYEADVNINTNTNAIKFRSYSVASLASVSFSLLLL